ncbi:MAG: ABC transporter permease [Oscillospiraceae bacterium]|nr:ABC transporter permease [Oscillospiraceae bacterium]
MLEEKSDSRTKDIISSFKKDKVALTSFFVIVFLIFLSIFGRLIVPYDPDAQQRKIAHQTPSLEHWFGTDEHGRDIFSRIINGTKTSVLVGLTAVVISLFIGTLFGSLAGYYGGGIDNFIMRIMDIILSIPSTLLAICLMAAFGRGLDKAIIAMGIVSMPDYAMIVRGSILSEKENDYVEAAKIVGASDFFVIFRSILPNIISSLIVRATLGISSAILGVAGLGFLGLGVQPPTAEWGDMLGRSKSFMLTFPHEVFSPGVAIFVTVLAFNLFGDGLRDAFDPKSKNR